MQISDYVSQYHQNTNTQAEPIAAKKGVERLVSQVRSMPAGNIFEGTVNSIKNGKVVLGLSNGHELVARMDGKVPISVGQSMFFQVKSNDGNVIAIRPFTVDGNQANLTLMNALKASGLALDARNLSMVNRMMEEQMPIDKNSVMQMARIGMTYPGIDIQTIVQMQKLNLPISPESASQFENYMADRQAIAGDLDAFLDTLPQTMADDALSFEQLAELNERLLSVATEPEGAVTENMAAGAQAAEVGAQAEGAGAGAGAEGTAGTQTGAGAAGAQAAGAEVGAGAQATGADAQAAGAEAGAQAAGAQTADGAANAQAAEGAGAQAAAEAGAADGTGSSQAAEAGAQTGDAQAAAENAEATRILTGSAPGQTPQFPAGSLGSILSRSQLSNLQNQISGTPELRSFLEDQLKTPVSGQTQGKDLLAALKNALSSNTFTQKEQIQKLFGGKELHALIKDAMQQQWTLKPEEIREQGKVRNLYEKIERQVKEMEEAVRSAGGNREDLHQAAGNVRDNITFMNQVNEMYTYVQVPLKMSGQTANGELYVYTNKKNLSDPEKDLTAFLHLDMEHLGSTDVSLRLHRREVTTKFYFDSDESYELVTAHVPELEARLKKKGYTCDISVVNEAKHVNFVEDFLKKDQPAAGTVRRYSFDMRA